MVEENFTTISLEIANEVKTFRKDNLKSYRYITRDQIKSIKEFDNPNPIYTNIVIYHLHTSLKKEPLIPTLITLLLVTQKLEFMKILKYLLAIFLFIMYFLLLPIQKNLKIPL